MALPSSGSISLNQMHAEVGGGSGTTVSLNDSDVRGLIGKASGASMSFNEWHGASAVKWQFNVTARDSDYNINNLGYDSYCLFKSCSQYDRVGYSTYGDRTSPSNSITQIYGSTTDTTCDFKSGAVLKKLNWHDLLGTTLTLELAGSQTNAGFTTMTIGSASFSRSSATHASATNTRLNATTTTWTWSVATNPLPPNTTRTVTFT